MNLFNKIFYSIIAVILTNQSVFAKAAKAAKAEPTFVLQKFALAIGLVIFSCVFLYYILFLYKKYFLQRQAPTQETIVTDSLKSASNLDEAIMTFLDKTKPGQ